MNELDVEKADAEFESLLKTCREMSDKMWNENMRRECFLLKIMEHRMSEIRYKIRLAKGFLNLWGRVGNTDCENDFKRLANYCFNDLTVELNINIIYAEMCLGNLRLMELFSCWLKLCKFYRSYYALKFTYARNNET